jgi:ABC-2 type transport system permease protein
MNYKVNLIAFKTIFNKEIKRFIRIWPQTLLPAVITQTLYFLIFGSLIGSQINSIGGVSYMQFILPGLIMMAMINNSFANVVSSFFGAKFQKNIEELLVSPASSSTIIAGFVLGGMARGILTGILVYAVSLFFIPPSVSSLAIIGLYSILTTLVFSQAGLLNGLFATKFDDVSIFTTFILTPLIYLGGVFYSVKDLPMIWQNISKFNPILYMVDGFRFGFYGESDFSIFTSISILIAFSLILFGANLYIFKKGYGLRS